MPKLFRKNHCSRHNWAGQSTATGLVDAGDARDTGGTQLPLVTESTASIHRQESSADSADFPQKNLEGCLCAVLNWTRRSSSLHYSFTAIASLPLRVRK